MELWRGDGEAGQFLPDPLLRPRKATESAMAGQFAGSGGFPAHTQRDGDRPPEMKRR